MESGYNHYRSEGGKVGRKEGYRKSDDEMKAQYTEEIKLLKKSYSLRNVSKLTGTSVNTLRKLQVFVWFFSDVRKMLYISDMSTQNNSP